MSLQTSRLFLLLCVCVCLSLPSQISSSTKSGCFKVNDCKCIMKDGSGVINLKAMGDAEGFLGRLRPVEPQELQEDAEVLLTFSPCLTFSQPEEQLGSQCSGVAACLTVRHQGPDGTSSYYLSYGRHEGNQFHYNQSLKTLSVSYYGSDPWPLSVVHYHCSPERWSSLLLEARLLEAEPLQVWVESPCACPNACAMGDLGLGTIFLILLSLSAAAYFILGSCALRAFRSRGGGVQMSPEDSVWCMICFLCSERRPQRRQYADMMS